MLHERTSELGPRDPVHAVLPSWLSTNVTLFLPVPQFHIVGCLFRGMGAIDYPETEKHLVVLIYLNLRIETAQPSKTLLMSGPSTAPPMAAAGTLPTPRRSATPSCHEMKSAQRLLFVEDSVLRPKMSRSTLDPDCGSRDVSSGYNVPTTVPDADKRGSSFAAVSSSTSSTDAPKTKENCTAQPTRTEYGGKTLAKRVLVVHSSSIFQKETYGILIASPLVSAAFLAFLALGSANSRSCSSSSCSASLGGR